MICKIKALCWSGIEHKTPSVTYFYTEVNSSNKDILKIGNFVIRKVYYPDNILYTYLILNRELLPSRAGMDIKIEYVFYDELSVLLKHDKIVSYYDNHYLIEHEFGGFRRYNNIDEVLDAIKFFKDTEGNQFLYIAGDYKIEACNWKYIEANYFKEEKQNNSLEQAPEKEKPVKMVLLNGKTILESAESTPPYLTIHNCCATSYTDLVKAMEKINYEENDNKKKNGGKSMFNNLMKNFKFGKMDTNAIKYSFNGIAFATNDGSYVVYNSDMTFTNVSDMVMDIPIYAMPVAKSDIEVGDIIKHHDTFVIVQSITDTEIRVANPLTREVVNIIPEKSIFGFDFYSKVIDFTKNFNTGATENNPFGNLPLLMMMDNKKDNGMLMYFMMNNGEKIDFNSPMMMYLMMSNSDDKSNLLPLLLMNQNKEKRKK